MNRMNIKKMIFILIFLVAFFAFEIKASALKMTSVRPSYVYGLEYYMKNGSSTTRRVLSDLFVFVAENNGTVRQAYCLQPGVSMAVWNNNQYFRNGSGTTTLSLYTGDEDPSELGLNYESNFKDADVKNRILQVLNYAYEYQPGKTNLTDFANACVNISSSNYQKIIAAQALIWEVVTKERTNFTSYAPDQKVSGGIYDLIFSKSQLSGAQTEYKRIVDAVYNSYYRPPGNNKNTFKIDSKATTIEMNLHSSYTISDEKNAFKYFKVVEETNGLKAEISQDGSKITIKATKAISSDSPGTIKISLKDVKNESTVYKCTEEPDDGRKGCQDFVYGGTSIQLSIKAYTSKYKIRIVKQDEDGNHLEGAKFNICKDSKCNTVLNHEPIITGSDGQATYGNITELGTYYVKEIEAPLGYQIDSTPKKVTISNSDTVSITFVNEERKFDLTKKTVDEDGNFIDLDDGCGTESYTGPEFKLLDENGNDVLFEQISDGVYKQANKTENASPTLRTCNGKFSVKLLTSCNYTIIEVRPPQGLILPKNPKKAVNICGSDKNISFTNGFTGLEFQKKNEEGQFISGGKFALQRKENNVYKDVLLREVGLGSYVFESTLDENEEGATYEIETDEGIARIAKIAPGEYRIVEKEAPKNYEPIEDNDSTAKITIKDGQEDDYYLVELINKKVNVAGDEASAELIVTITTGRKVINYVLVFSVLISILIALIIIRKKMKK